MTQKYYFVCSIGPVQDFIKTARASQDLWFGSWMLSELSKAAAKALKDARHTLVFPAPEMDLSESDVDVTNKVVAVLKDNTPQNAAEAILTALETRRNDLRDVAFGRVQGKFRGELAQEQLKALTEFYWAAAPLINDDYATARTRAEALLAARKNTRNFQQAHGRPGLPKSSLDGWRESVLPINKKDAPYWVFKADKGEALSGIDLLKRWGKRQDSQFISTTDVAVIPFVETLDAHIGQVRRDEFQGRVRELLKHYTESDETSGTMFYIDRLVQLIGDDKHPENFRAEYANLRDEYEIKGEPSPYYALLLADGDNMGKMIDALTQQSQHSALSQALSAFAPEAKNIINKYKGVPVYVGGDDVLAYLPLHTALECIQVLDKVFSNALKEFHYEGDKSPTLSVGLAIAHHLNPLSDALEQARNAEKEAKKIAGKNGLVISMSKRSGSERIAKGKLGQLVERMNELVTLTQANAISHGAAYELENLHKRMQNSELPAEALEKETLRILKRKRESGSEKPVDEGKMTRLVEQFKNEDGNLQLNKLAVELMLALEFANVQPKKEQ